MSTNVKLILAITITVTGLAFVISTPALLHRAKRWEQDNYPDKTLTFDCHNRPIGFYADVEHNCQVFHMCDADGVRIPHICANGTAFNQQYRICDWDYNVDCADAPNWYYLNELTFATDPPRDFDGDY